MGQLLTIREGCWQVLVGKLERRRPRVRPRRRWKNNNIKIDHQEIVSEGLTVINLPWLGKSDWLF